MAAFTVYVVGWHTVYPRVMLLMYSTQLWGNIDHAIKIISNLVAFHERSLIRNLMFNSVRCMSDEVTNHLTF